MHRKRVNVFALLDGKEFGATVPVIPTALERIARRDATARIMLFVIRSMVSVLARQVGPENDAIRSANRVDLDGTVRKPVTAVWSIPWLVTQLRGNVSVMQIGAVFVVKAAAL